MRGSTVVYNNSKTIKNHSAVYANIKKYQSNMGL